MADNKSLRRAVDFVHLRALTNYSFFRSLTPITNLIATAKRNRMKAIAITDINMHGTILFYKFALKCDIKPILGCEINILKTVKNKPAYYSIILLAMNNDGYYNLMKIVSDAHCNYKKKPSTTESILKKYSSNLIALSGGRDGEINSLLLEKEYIKAEKLARKYKNIFNDNFYLEIQNIYSDHKRINKRINALGIKYNIPIVATNTINFIDKKNYPEFKSLIKKEKDPYSKTDIKYLQKTYFRSKNEMTEEFSDYPDALRNTITISEKCNVKLDMNTKHYPLYLNRIQPEKTHDILKKEVYAGINKKFEKITEKIKKRTSLELKIINKKNLSWYFLIYYDIIKFAKKNNIFTGFGRGTYPSSIVCYALGISKIDPIKNNLIFELFLDPNTNKFPDIALEVSAINRNKIFKYLKDIYSEKASFISHINRRDGFTYNSERFDPSLIISDKNLDQFTPFFKDKNGKIISHYGSMDFKALGLLKFDILGLTSLDKIYEYEKATKTIDPTFELSKVPLNDKLIFEYICHSKKDLFMIYRKKMTSLIKEFKPYDICDLASFIALFFQSRNHELAEDYIKILEETHSSIFSTPKLRAVSENTRGFYAIWKEQLIELFHIVTDYSYSDSVSMIENISTGYITEMGMEDLINKCCEKGYDHNLMEWIISIAETDYRNIPLLSHFISATTTLYFDAASELIAL